VELSRCFVSRWTDSMTDRRNCCRFIPALTLGRGRVLGNQRGPCFSRQISMYLAKSVGGWSTTRIGRFYNGRHHTTVLHAIGKIERLREIR